MHVRAKLLSNEYIELEVVEERHGNTLTVMPICSDYGNIEYIDVGYDYGCAKAGDMGYYIVPQGHQDQDSFITEFKERENSEYMAGGKSYFLPIFGVRHPTCSFFARADGMKEVCNFIVGVEDGRYYLYPRFMINCDTPYEQISIVYTFLEYEQVTYSSIAGMYRDYLLENKICTPIKERMTPALEYAKESLYIRIRQAWKPVPSPIPEQTDENEPSIHVACTFARVIDLMEECKAQGIDKAEFCLVGFNKSGHDGRWPQIFPIEPLLGGEDELKRLIDRAKELGYTVSCHTNSSEAYSVADIYDEDELLLDKQGNNQVDLRMWGGGMPRKICPQNAYETAKNELPKLKELGFNGLHYIDVIGIDDLLHCYSDKHPCNEKQSAEYNRKMGELCHELFGGFSTEGARNFITPILDYALYLTFRNPDESLTVLADRYIPLWQLIYHGICLSNPFTQTVNVTLKSKQNRLMAYEYGARPTFYYYSKFMTDPNADWMGTTDMRCGTDEELKESVSMLKKIYDEYKAISYLQDCFMVNHECRESDKVLINYSDGTQMAVDYKNYSVQVLKDSHVIYEMNI